MTTTAEAAAQSMIVLQRVTDVLANNVANANTPGFEQVVTQVTGDLPRDMFRADGQGVVPLGALQGLPGPIAHAVDPRPGVVTQTGNPLDLALDGPGYWTVRSPAGTALTRNGRFHLDPQGQLVTGAGLPVLGVNGAPIVIPAGTASIQVAADGTVSADGTVVGQLLIVAPPDPRTLVPLGGGLYQAPASSAAAPGTTTVAQGAVEGSNVSLVVAMTQLIEVLRAYESAQHVMQVDDSLSTLAAETVGAVP
jgi:flagellar basal-body rod protein FlgF